MSLQCFLKTLMFSVMLVHSICGVPVHLTVGSPVARFDMACCKQVRTPLDSDWSVVSVVDKVNMLNDHCQYGIGRVPHDTSTLDECLRVHGFIPGISAGN